MEVQMKDGHPARPNSTDEDPFDDFDGVHFTKNPRQADRPAPIEGDKSTHGVAKEQRLSSADRGDLVYYPAPVPVMLNLPPKLTANRTQSQSHVGIEDIRARRESLTSLRRSLVLKASHSKADASSLFDNILDATVASPVLSVVNHSISNTRAPGASGHTRSTSKFSMSVPKIESTPSGPQVPARHSALSDSGDEPELPKEARPQSTIMRSSAMESEATVGFGGVADGVANALPRASYYPHSNHDVDEEGRGEEEEGGGGEGNDIQFVPATLLAELESRKTQQRARTNKAALSNDSRQMPTLLERDAIAEVKKQARKRGPVNLGWQGDRGIIDEEEDDVPLGVLFANKLSSRPAEALRAPGLLAMREAEDNEPLRRRQERLKHTMGKETTDNLPITDAMDEKETLGQRRSRLQAAQRQRDHIGDKPNDQEELEATGPPAVGSMSAVLQANPQRSHLAAQEISARGMPNPELPFGYQAQQQMHINFTGSQPLNRPLTHQRKPMLPYQQDPTGLPGKNRDYEFGIPFPYAPVNAEYLQHQQALLADQIERWRSSVW